MTTYSSFKALSICIPIKSSNYIGVDKENTENRTYIKRLHNVKNSFSIRL